MPIPTARPLSRRPSGFLAAFLLCLGLLVAPAVQAAMPDAEFVQLCVEGDLAAVRRALQEGANPNAADKHGETALMQALAPMSVAAAVGKSPEPAIKGAFWMRTLPQAEAENCGWRTARRHLSGGS